MLILIRYDSCKVPGKLLGRTFLDWTSDDVRPHFWKRLFESVGDPGNYGSTWNQSGMNQDGWQSEKQNGGQNEKQNGCKSEDQNGDVNQRKNSTSKGIERSVSCTKDDSENVETNINFVGGELKLIDINIDGNVNSIDSDTGGLLENHNDIIDIHAPVIKT